MKIWLKATLFCYFLFPLNLNAASALRVEVSAKGAILMNAETGAVLWEKNAHTPLYPASTTKMITALYALEKKRFALDEMVTASHEAISTVHPNVRRASNGTHPPYRLEFGGTHMGIKVGETLSLQTLFYGLMLVSGNDAANVIAEHVSGDITTFTEEMNRFACEKGCKNTVLRAPHGLPDEKHKTTAYDLGLLAREFLKNDFLCEIAKTKQFIRPQTNKQAESILHQHNALVKPGHFFYPKAIGIKTGYTIAAGHCIVTAAADENRKLIVVLLGCEKREQRYREAIALFEAAFNEKKVARTLFSKGFDLFSHEVEGGKDTLQAYLAQDIVLEYYPSEESVFKTSLAWQRTHLPIVIGQAVASIQVTSSEGKLLASAPLYAAKNVDPTLSHRASLVWKKVKQGVWGNATWVMALSGLLILGATFYCFHRPFSSKPQKEK
jgi:serine-type D-Ala-D-Ala carboxypeptidase (penicillin-binding protein 5/6)